MVLCDIFYKLLAFIFIQKDDDKCLLKDIEDKKYQYEV